MTRLGILQLPYNLDILKQITTQLSHFNGHVFLIDTDVRISSAKEFVLPSNLHFVACDSYAVDCIQALSIELQLDNLISLAELGLMPASQVRDRLCMSGHSAEVEKKSVDKHEMRVALAKAGLTNVKFKKSTIDQLPHVLNQFNLPVIVKPVSLTGSIGVQLIKDITEIADYSSRLKNNAYANGCELIIESFLPGAEFSVEGMLLDGEIQIYGVTEKETTEQPYFVETGHRFETNHSLLSWLHPALKKVFEALDMTICPFHVEFKIVDGCLEIIELHSRFGGDFVTKLIEFSSGNKVFLEYAEFLCHGSRPRINRADAQVTAVKFSTVSAGRIASISPLSDAFIGRLLEHKIGVKEGDLINPETGYYDRPAYFISRFKNSDEEVFFQNAFNQFKIITNETPA
ncbi:ATP-grasp domain-containing protein [Endozoicomonas acroporae]|uniref:ATP-grasp domain-containing protein n=1 Tax=Endozoicomonas acroporae TaxID=1701104 RepID=UPI003D795678